MEQAFESYSQVIDTPPKCRVGLISDHSRKPGVIQIQAGLHHIFIHKVRGVFNPLFYLYVGTGYRHHAPVNYRVPAGNTHFLKYSHR